jgi:hypothetical protein
MRKKRKMFNILEHQSYVSYAHLVPRKIRVRFNKFFCIKRIQPKKGQSYVSYGGPGDLIMSTFAPCHSALK